MANKVHSKCLGCGEIFTVDVRNRGRQKYCPKRACRAAGKAARQRRWLEKPENRITSADRSTSSGCGHGGRPIRAIGARTDAAEGLRYKTC